PEVAILGVGKLEKRVRVREINGEDQIQIVPSCYVTLSIDHRALDAFQTNAWLAAFVDALENWPAD
ncbi:MAG: 2-oxo acid dehydrogenase subunit E2, partial [Pseudomonadota bacterium]